MKLAWHSVVLLPALLLPIVVTQAQTCSNGFAGYEASGVCCNLECGQCGGVGCSDNAAQVDPFVECCTKAIREGEVFCTESESAPCIIDNAGDDDEEEEVETCSNGLAGFEAAGVCCSSSCGRCGGAGCSSLPGGKECCTNDVKLGEVFCSESEAAPCIIDDAGDDDGEEEVETDETCSNGFAGYEASGVCCNLECGQCGGVGCSDNAALVDPFVECCTKAIREGEVFCTESESAPCIIDNAGDDDEEEEVETCSNGLAGFEAAGVCCSSSCGRCGGAGCSSLPGGKECCTNDIKLGEVFCSESEAAPCIIDDAGRI